MKARKIVKGDTLIQKGERVRHLYVLLQGTCRASYKTMSWELEPGSIVGILECHSEKHICEYQALTDCVLYVCDYCEPEDFRKIFMEESKYVSVFFMAAVRQAFFFLRRYEEYLAVSRTYYGFLMGMFQKYEHFCEMYHISVHSFGRMDMAQPFAGEQKIDKCMSAFYHKLASRSVKEVDEFLKRDVDLGIGEIVNSTEWMQLALRLTEDLREYIQVQKTLLVNDKEDNLLQRFVELTVKVTAEGMDTAPLKEALQRIIDFARKSKLYEEKPLAALLEKYENYDFTNQDQEDVELAEESGLEEADPFGSDFVQQLLSFAGYEEEKGQQFLADLAAYKDLPDQLSTSDEVRVLRRRLTKSYYEVYMQVFRRVAEGARLTNGLRMFLNFGFLDAELAGEKVTKSLYEITQKLYLCKAANVYTIHEWLMSIYKGENEPSRNEFDLDYPAYLQEQKRSGDIREEDMKRLLDDNWAKVQFEIENMLTSNGKMTYGKISTFCPILSEYDVINSAEHMLVTAEKINTALDYIRSIDFSIFYRKIVFSDPDRDINMEMIEKEVLPNVILMPNTGSRGMMWQEISGVRKDTPARFMLPILSAVDVMEQLIDICGRYRWEICRKIQGVRWNDVTDPSLTSEYNDYIQYYRKNHELSAEAKEKIKNALYKSKNNFREVFVKDYQSWINYEAKGSFRLNKVARDLFLKYCPFSKSIRQALRINPMYQEIFQRYDAMNERSIRRIEMLYDRYRKKGGTITKELQDNRDFYDL